ncbi:hypothetical protein GUITHDRAFT_141658 [Guillardia theta CCMP2712]|uniref:Uncharacterized protein n=1 Tax=Guillardia theta (strain CCMP2712) TaxID=905079 RepID=L1J1A1_GUITC|nr:hypothetical protein GUITHDRAFT_141658 [Guillardia theta CCMP2712]EKX41919.1 hypothetical protein GUITHDRAFT_141658 [Guillardia theta CCMP2712]|eukprot:XP_005828899.1 hypothetical protein GUITHDRAFT_141658 [Guillardia theta CCMP2712]
MSGEEALVVVFKVKDEPMMMVTGNRRYERIMAVTSLSMCLKFRQYFSMYFDHIGTERFAISLEGNSKTFRFSLDAPESSPNSIMTRLRIPLLFQYMPISELDANQFIEFLEDFEKGHLLFTRYRKLTVSIRVCCQLRVAGPLGASSTQSGRRRSGGDLGPVLPGPEGAHVGEVEDEAESRRQWVTVEAAKLLVSMKAAGEDGGGMWIVSSDHRKSSTAAAEAEAEQERSARHSDDRGAMESLSPLRRSSHWHSSPDLTKLALLRSTSSKSLDGNRGGDRSEPGVGTAQLASRNLEAQEAEEGGRELAIDSMVARACVLGKPIDLEDLGPNGRSFEQLHLLFGLSQCARNSLL